MHPTHQNLSVHKTPRRWEAGDSCLEPGATSSGAGLGSEFVAADTRTAHFPCACPLPYMALLILTISYCKTHPRLGN